MKRCFKLKWITKDAVSCERLALSLKVLDVVHAAVNDRPEAAVFVVVLQVGFADERHLFVVLGALSREERACPTTNKVRSH